MNAPRTALALVGLAVLSACDLPTEAPILEQRWILPVESTEISVAELLPSGVSISGNAFSVSVATFTTSKSLGELCGTCGPFQGLTVPAPAFTGSFSVSQPLPAKVSAAALQSGSVSLAIQNGWGFDPAAGGGSVTVTLSDGPGGRSLGQATLTALPANSTVTRTLTLAAGPVGASLYATVAIQSNGGQVTTIDNNQRMSVTATPGPILVSSASVNVAGETVTIDPVDLDVEDIESDVADRIESGSLILSVTNPFGVALSLQAVIQYPGGTISKTLSIGSAATSTATLQYSGDELRAFLGQPNVRFTGNGTVASSAGVITVTPSQKASFDAKLDVTLTIGG